MAAPAAAQADAPSLPVRWTEVDALPGPVGLAVSGGADSTALAVLFAQQRRERIGALLTVNHGLRVEAADDVGAVEALGARLKVPVVALSAGPRHGSLQAWAREERYRLMAGAAHARGLAAIALGHTLDDQAETLLLRMARGSGVKGLGAMRPLAVHHGISIVRPLLDCPRESLRAHLERTGFGWREDPSNHDDAFQRVAMRQLGPRLAAVGLTPARLAATAAHLARADAAIDAAVEAVLASAAWDRAGALTLPYAALAAAPEEVRLRALSRVIADVGGKTHTPDFAALVAAAKTLTEGGRTTLGRALLWREGGHVVAWREARGIEPLTLDAGAEAIFDGRFHARHAGDASPLTIAALGEKLARRLPAVARREAMATAPVILADGRPVAAPTLGFRARGAGPTGVVLTRVR